jgi:hypothetical protein
VTGATAASPTVVTEAMIQMMVNSTAAAQNGVYRPDMLSLKPVLKEATRLSAEWWNYWKRTTVMDEKGWCEKEHYAEAMQDLKNYGLSEGQYEAFHNDMILQNEFETSRDKQVPFRFHVDWMEKWIISS